MKKTGMLVLALIFLWVAPSFAGKQALNEDDLDRITAAGQPTFVQITNSAASTASVAMSFDNLDTDILDVQPNSQNNLRALTLNNVVGENQIGNALNVKANGSGSQNNRIDQSWGSIDVTGVETVAVATAASASINVTASATSSTTNSGKCVGLNPCNKGTTSATATNTGNANAAAVAVALAVPEFIAADQIVIIDNSSSDGEANTILNFQNESVASLTVENNSQTGLAALVVNNVVGKNQVANGTNIASSGDIGIGVANGTGTALVLSGTTGREVLGDQTNIIQQFRGTPINAAAVPVGIGVGATGGVIHGVGVSGTTVTPF